LGKIRVLLVDDQVLFIESLKFVLTQRSQDIEVIGVAYEGVQAVALAQETKPDMVVLDVRMPKQDGVVTAKQIHAFDPNIKILMLTTFADDEYVREAVLGGAAGYILKSIPPDELIKSIIAVNNSITQISPEVMAALVKTVGVGEQHIGAAQSPLESLTNREREILGLLLRAFDNKSIADKLCLSEGTVKNHIHNIYQKFDVVNRYQLMRSIQDNAPARDP